MNSEQFLELESLEDENHELWYENDKLQKINDLLYAEVLRLERLVKTYEIRLEKLENGTKVQNKN